MQRLDILAALREILATSLELPAADWPPEAPLLDGLLGVDSVAILELVAGIEERFSIVFEDADVVPATFANLESLASVVEARLGA